MVHLPPGLLKCLKFNWSKNKLIITALEPAPPLPCALLSGGLPHPLPCPQFSWQQNPGALASQPCRRPPPPIPPHSVCGVGSSHTRTHPKAEGRRRGASALLTLLDETCRSYQFISALWRLLENMTLCPKPQMERDLA